MKVKCNRCGKETNKKDSVLVSQNDCFNGYEESYWCKPCYENFVNDVENSEKAFKDIKPATTQDFGKNVKEFIKKWCGEESMKKTKDTKYFICVKNDRGNFIKLVEKAYESPKEAMEDKVEFITNLSTNQKFTKEREYIINHVCIMQEINSGSVVQKEFIDGVEKK